MVLFSIMAGILSLKDIKKVGMIGGTTLVYYFCTTAIAITLGLIFGNVFKGFFPSIATADLSYEVSSSSSFMDVL